MTPMWRMRGLIKRILALNNPYGHFSDWYLNEFTERELVDGLVGQEFLIDVRVWFLRRLYGLLKRWPPSTNWSLAQARLHRKRLHEVFEACIKRGYLKKTASPNLLNVNQSTIKVDQDGVEFLEWLRFFNAFISEKEYGKFLAFVFGVIGTGIAGVFLAKFETISDGWTNFLFKLFFK